jgi:hypothetical protein
VTPASGQWQDWTADSRTADIVVPTAAQSATPLAAMVLLRGLLAFLAALGTSVWRIANHL